MQLAVLLCLLLLCYYYYHYYYCLTNIIAYTYNCRMLDSHWSKGSFDSFSRTAALTANWFDGKKKPFLPLSRSIQLPRAKAYEFTITSRRLYYIVPSRISTHLPLYFHLKHKHTWQLCIQQMRALLKLEISSYPSFFWLFFCFVLFLTYCV